jgi:hypothetical protein
MARAETAQARRQPAGAQRRQNGQAQSCRIHVSGAHETGAQRVEGPGGLHCDARTGGGQFHMLGVAQEQAGPGLGLQPAHVVTHRCRTGVELLGGAGEAAQPCRRLEGADGDKRWQLALGHHKCGLA